MVGPRGAMVARWTSNSKVVGSSPIGGVLLFPVVTITYFDSVNCLEALDNYNYALYSVYVLLHFHKPL